MTFTEIVKRCPVCGGSYSCRIAHRDRYKIDATWTVCMRCSLVYLNPRPTELEYESFYKGEYRKLILTYRGPQDLEKNQWHYGYNLAAWLADMNVRPASVVDVGGSTGIIASHVAGNRPGCKVTVIDPCDEELAKAKTYGFETICRQIGDIGLGGLKPEFVMLCRVIDHLAEPRKSLQSIVNAMPEESLIYIDHCDFAFVARREGFTNALHIDHPSNFSRDSIHALFREVGLKPIAEYRPPHSTCYGYLLEKGVHGHFVPEDISLFSEIRRFQSHEQ
jgi:hypothetical protein